LIDDVLKQNSEFRTGHSIRVGFDEEAASQRLAVAFSEIICESGSGEVIIVCVGTDRSTGDAFGPIIGSKLTSMGIPDGVHVYGTLDEPVHAVNLSSTLDLIANRHKSKVTTIAIDACLGSFENVGQIILESGPLRPGAGVKKALPPFGDYTLTGVVNVSGFMEYFVLQNTRLGIVMRMTEIVLEALKSAMYRRKVVNDLRFPPLPRGV